MLNDSKMMPSDKYAIPLTSLVESEDESKFSAFICEHYPSSCSSCCLGWYHKCLVHDRTHNTRPLGCPLITPTYLYDEKLRVRYPALDEDEWVTRNPIFIAGAVIISKDRKQAKLPYMKIGDGKSRYNSLPFVITDESTPTINISLNIKELVKLISVCNTAIAADEETLRNLSNTDIKVKNSIETSIKEILEIKNKIKRTINSVYGQNAINNSDRKDENDECI